MKFALHPLTLALTLGMLSVSHPGQAATIAAPTANQTAVVGSGYQSEKELVVGECLTGTTVSTGSSTSSFSMEQALTERQASDSLGVSLGGRARFGVVEISAAARFFQSSVSNKFSASAVWESFYYLPVQRLTSPTLTSVGTSVRNDFDRWAITCGDEYVVEVRKGAKLLFAIRLEFTSEDEKKSFESQFRISGPMYSASADLNAASQRFSRDTKVTVSGIQIGGDVSKITQIFPNSVEGRSGYVDCTLGDFSKCASVLAGALEYATNTDTGFPSQLKQGATPGGSDIEYKSQPYSAAGIFLDDYPGLTDVIRQARAKLHSDFEHQFSLVRLTDILLSYPMEKDKRDAILTQRKAVDNNVVLILEASKTCYSQPEKCPDAVNALGLTVIDESVFELPPPPKASFRLFSTTRGLWSRDESIAKLCWGVAPTWSGTSEFGKVPPPSNCRNLQRVAAGDDLSVVLFVEGVGLKTASLKFEQEELAPPIQLDEPTRRKAGKAGEGWGLLVLQSTRLQADWIDFNPRISELKFREKVFQGDGVIYVLIRDVFGRDARFDVAYVKWKTTAPIKHESIDGLLCVTFSDYSTNRWWDSRSAGVSAGGEGNWTYVNYQNDSWSCWREGAR